MHAVEERQPKPQNNRKRHPMSNGIMKNPFHDILKGKVVIIGIGNILRGDDGLGPVLIDQLKGQVQACCLDVGTTPESYAGKITKEDPDVILFVDALHLDRLPGTYAILEKDDIMKSGFTTHDMSARMFIEYLQSQTSAQIYMLGVQPQNLSLGEGISDQVRKSLDEIVTLLKEGFHA